MSKKDEERIMEDFRSGMISMNTAKREIQAIRARETIEQALAKELPVSDVTITIKARAEYGKAADEAQRITDQLLERYPSSTTINIEIEEESQHGRENYCAAGCQSPGNIPE